jgi:MFS family permease
MNPTSQRDRSAPEAPRSIRRVAAAAFVGNAIETYDFAIFATASALVFAKVFFPAMGPVGGTVASFATLGVLYVARPFGSVLFGHFGDRLGRKKALVTTLLLMGISTLLVGLMPTPGQIGAASPILLVVLRILQGISAGGEWAGAALFSAEQAPPQRRGFYAMFPSFGGGIGLILAPAMFLLVSSSMSDDAFVRYGWRIPFLGSIVLIGVGLWVRLGIEESVVFEKVKASTDVAKVPLVEAFTQQWKQIVLATGAVMSAYALLYIGATYMVNFGTSIAHLDRGFVLIATMLGAVADCVGVALGGWLSDRIGRRRVMLWASAAGVVWSIALFPILGVHSAPTFAIGVMGSMFLGGFAFGPVGAFLPELFATRYRYTATAVSYNVAGVLGGALPPIIAASLITDSNGGLGIGALLGVICLISLVSVSALSDRKRAALTDSDEQENVTLQVGAREARNLA